MEIESNTIPEETLIALLAQQEDFTEEQIGELQQKLPLMERELERRKVSPEMFKRLEVERQNMLVFEAMVKEQIALVKEKAPKKEDVLAEGQTGLTAEVSYKLLSAVPTLRPSLSHVEHQYVYFGYSTQEKHYLKVSSQSGELLYEIEIVKEFLS